jgi:hypothetical protein
MLAYAINVQSAQFPPFHIFTSLVCPRFPLPVCPRFPLPVCPRFSVACLSALSVACLSALSVACLSALFRRLFVRAYLFGGLFSPSPSNSRRFD